MVTSSKHDYDTSNYYLERKKGIRNRFPPDPVGIHWFIEEWFLIVQH